MTCVGQCCLVGLHHVLVLRDPDVGKMLRSLNMTRCHLQTTWGTRISAVFPQPQVMECHRNFLQKAVQGLLLSQKDSLACIVKIQQCAAAYCKLASSAWDKLDEQLQADKKNIQVSGQAQRGR